MPLQFPPFIVLTAELGVEAKATTLVHQASFHSESRGIMVLTECTLEDGTEILNNRKLPLI